MRPILHLPNNNQTSQHITNLIAQKMDFSIQQIEKNQLNNINTTIEQQDAALLIIGLDNNNQIQPYLNQCRNLRIPYIFIKNDLPPTYNINNIILPITNLEEEREKAPFTASFARHFNTPITIYKPNDYGTKATTNIQTITHLFDTLNLQHTTTKGKTNSTKIQLEAAQQTKNQQNTLLIITASRDYGLDDIIFGPQERKIIQQTNQPTMLINPRGDLYTLCD